jgi:hypothetical protein
MIIERPIAAIKHLSNIIAIVLAWFVATPLLTLVPGFTATVRVIAPSQTFLTRIPKETSILEWSSRSITLNSSNIFFVVDLYKSGALLVIPASGGGCVARPFAQR